MSANTLSRVEDYRRRLSQFGVIVSHQTIEEPDEVKVSRPVLKTSGRGDSSTAFTWVTGRVYSQAIDSDIIS